MKNEQALPRFLASVLFLTATAGLFAFSVPKPSAEVTDFRLEAISLRDVTFKFVLAVKNPYPIALAYEAIIKLVKNYVEKEWLNTVIDGTLTIPIPKIASIPGLPPNVTFGYEFKKKIPAIKPQVAILDFAVTPPTEAEIAKAAVDSGKKVNSKKALGAFKDLLAGKKPTEQVIDPAELDVPLRVSYTISLKNEARGPLSFDKLGYELFVNGETLVVGESSKLRREEGRTLVTVDNVFSSRKLSKNVKALFAEKGGRFGVKGSAMIKLPDEIRKEPVSLGVDEAGVFKLR
jgi:hypothetical protein